MTKEPNGTGPDLIVLGPDDEGKQRAARFPAGQADLVAKAAKAMNLTVGVAAWQVATQLVIERPSAVGGEIHDLPRLPVTRLTRPTPRSPSASSPSCWPRSIEAHVSDRCRNAAIRSLTGG